MCIKASAFTLGSQLAVPIVCNSNLFTVICHLCFAAPRRVIGAAAEVSQPTQSAIRGDEGGVEASLEAAPHVTHEGQVLEPLQSAFAYIDSSLRLREDMFSIHETWNGIASAATEHAARLCSRRLLYSRICSGLYCAL